MAIETQYGYADPKSSRLFKRTHDTDTGAVTEFVPCTDDEQKKFESDFQKQKAELRKKIKAEESKKEAERAMASKVVGGGT